MATLRAYASNNDPVYELVIASPSDITSSITGSLRIFQINVDHTTVSPILTLEGATFTYAASDGFLTGGAVIEIPITATQFTSLQAISQFIRDDGGITRVWFDENQIEIYNTPTIPTATTQGIIGTTTQDPAPVRIDLFDDDNITLKRTIQDIRDIKKVFTDFSHQLTVPATKNNNAVFAHMMRTDVNTVDPRAYKRAFIELSNGTPIAGYVLVNNAKKESGQFVSYDIRFFGELVQLPQLLGSRYLKDLDDLQQYNVPIPEEQVRRMLTTAPHSVISGLDTDFTDNVVYTLGAYDRVYIFDTSTDLYTDGDNGARILTTATAARNGVSGIEDAKVSNIATNTGARQGDAAILADQRRSVRCEAILRALEAQEWYANGPRLRFSRGVDAQGYPTNDPTRVVTDHFFNTNVFTNLLMLMHTKANAITFGGKLRFGNNWSNDFGGNNNETSLNIRPYYRNGRNYRRYYVNVSVTYSGDVEYILEATSDRSTGDQVVWTSGPQSGDFNNGNTRINLAGRITDGVGDGNSFLYGERLMVSNGEQNISFRLRKVNDDDDTLENVDVDVTVIQENVDGGSFPFYNFTRTVSEVSNSVGNISEASATIPNIKLMELLVGWWQLFNLTAYYDRDINNNPIIVTKTLDQFYNDGIERNLTQWLDSQELTVQSPAFYSDIEFKFEDPSTFFAKEFKDQHNYSYGDDKYSLRNDDDDNVINPLLPKRDYEIKLPFEQMVLTRLVDANTDSNTFTNVVVPYVVDDSYSETEIKPFLHYAESVALNHGTISFAGTGGVGSGIADEVNIMSKSLREESITSSGDIIQQLTFRPEIDERRLETSPNTLFRNYYERYIRESFSRRSRLYKYKGRLPQSFLNQYTLADLLLIGNDYFRINSINTNFGTGMSELELISLAERVRLDNLINQDIVEVPDFVASITGTSSARINTGVLLQASSNRSNVSYLWDDDTTTRERNVTNAEAGVVTYTVTITDEDNGDTAQATFDVEWTISGTSALARIIVRNNIDNTRVTGIQSESQLEVGDTFDLTVGIEALPGFSFLSGPIKNVGLQSTNEATHNFTGTIEADSDGNPVDQSVTVVWTGETRSTIVISLPQVTTVNATGVLVDEMQLNGSVDEDGGATISQRGFYYIQNTGDTAMTREQIVSSGTRVLATAGGEGPFSATIDNLLPNINYDFVAFATNSSGTGYGIVRRQETREQAAARISFERCDQANVGTLSDLDGVGDTYCVRVSLENLPDNIVNTTIQYITGGTGWISTVSRIPVGTIVEGVVSDGNIWVIQVNDFTDTSVSERVASILFTNPTSMISSSLFVSQGASDITLSVSSELGITSYDLTGGTDGLIVTSRGAVIEDGVVTGLQNYSLPWTITNANDIPDWLSVSPTSAFGSTTISATLSLNDTGGTRSFELAFANDDGSANTTHTITQVNDVARALRVYLLDANGRRRLTGAQTTDEISTYASPVQSIQYDSSGNPMGATPADGGGTTTASNDIEVVALPDRFGSLIDTGWTTSISNPISPGQQVNWISVSPTNDSGSQAVTIDVDTNNTGSTRVARITFTDTNANYSQTRQITVTQSS